MFKVVTWNVNSVGSRLARLLPFLQRVKPDVVCLQELKCTEDKFPLLALKEAGYNAAVYGQKTYNGVAILSKAELIDVQTGFGDSDEDPAARCISAMVGEVRVASVYIPNGQEVGSEKFQYKMRWLERMKAYLSRRYKPTDKLIVAGDFNIAPEDRDCHDPDLWRGKVLFSEPEKKALREICAFGLADTFRLHQREGGFYSWWDYRMLSFPKNKGMRIDFVLATAPLIERCTSVAIDREERKGEKPSDHAPVWAEFDIH